jgi:hypothetical protein
MVKPRSLDGIHAAPHADALLRTLLLLVAHPERALSVGALAREVAAGSDAVEMSADALVAAGIAARQTADTGEVLYRLAPDPAVYRLAWECARNTTRFEPLIASAALGFADAAMRVAS